MTENDIQGQVVNATGEPVSGAIVELTRSYESNPIGEESVFRTTTDSNGNYIFEGHPDGDGTTQEWHVSAYSHDGTAYVNSFNNPGVTAELPSNAIPDSGVARWTLDDADTESGTAIDVWGRDSDSITQNDATINGATTGVNGANQTYSTNEAYSFDGTDDYLQTPVDIDSSALPEMSIACWVNINGAQDTIIWSNDDGDDFDRELWLFEGSYHVQAGVSDNGGRGFDTGSSYSTDSWDHVVVVYRNNGLDFYRNGDDQNLSQTSSDSSSATDLRIGGTAKSSNYFDGEIDDFRIYNKGLSDTEVSDLYSTGSI